MARDRGSFRRGLFGILWALTMAAAVWVGRRIERAAEPRSSAVGSPADPRTASETARVPVPVIIPTGGNTIDLADIRQIVREELAAHLGTASERADARATESQSDAVPTTPETEARIADASGLIDRAALAGRWTADDREQFARIADDLPPPAMFELQRTLNTAINRGQVVPVDGFPPFGHQRQSH